MCLDQRWLLINDKDRKDEGEEHRKVQQGFKGNGSNSVIGVAEELEQCKNESSNLALHSIMEFRYRK